MSSAPVFALVAFFTVADAPAQIAQGIIHGAVIGPDDRPVDEAVVTLLDPLGNAVKSTTVRNGVFQLAEIAPGTYSLRADAPPLHAIVQTITISTALPVRIDLRVTAVASEQVIVRGEEAGPVSTTTRVTLAGESVRRAPARLRSRGLQDAIATTPGWATEDNGLLHVRGVDDGFLYVIDGVPVYERLDGLFGVAPDPAMIDSVNVVTGYVPPEYGFKSGGVIEVRSATRTADAWTGTFDFNAGGDATRDVSSVAGGPLSGTTALTVGLARQSSARFLDPVHPDNFHNQGTTWSGGAQFGWSLSPRSTLTTVTGFGRSDFDVPNDESEEAAHQAQRQRLRQHWQSVSWQRAWSDGTVSQIAGYHRFGSAALDSGEDAFALLTNADRSVHRFGLLASVTHQRGRHLLKFGGEAASLRLREAFAFAVTDAAAAVEAGLSDAAIAHTEDDPFRFHDTARPALLSMFVQDSIRGLDRLTIDLGVRADWSRMLVRSSQVSPRIGAAFLFPASQTTVRGSFDRFFQPPQPENLLLASSQQAQDLSPFVSDIGAGGAELHPERQSALEVAVNQVLAKTVRLDVSYWRRWITNAADPNVFFGTTIIFPNTVAKGRAAGIDVRLEVPRTRGWSGYASYTNSRVVQFGPITGGLFLEDDLLDIGPGTRFTPDHDQRNVGAVGLTYDHDRRGFWGSLTGRYESGTPLDVGDESVDDLRERPGADLVDFERRRVKPRLLFDLMAAKRVFRIRHAEVSLRLSVLNLADRPFAYNFGNPFSGTHFGAGRTAQVGVRIAFR